MKEVWSCLVRVKTNEGFRSHLIEKPSFTLGRTQEADLPLLEASVSRTHLIVQIKGELVWITDPKSANGTFLNGVRLEHGKTVPLGADDVVRVGTLDAEFRFMSIPKPFELSDGPERKSQMLASMEELAREIEGKARAKAEADMKQARLEIEQAVATAKREAEVVKTNALIDLQNRKQELQTEISTLRAQAQTVAAEEKLKAQKEADLLVAEAQRRVQRELAETSERVDARLKAVQKQSHELMAEADAKARKAVTEARDEAAQIRSRAAEEARLAQNEVIRKGEEAMAEMQANHRAALAAQEKTFDERCATLKADVARHERDKESLDRALAGIRAEYEAARKLLSEVKDLEAKRSEATAELANLRRRHEEESAAFTREIQARRDAAAVDHESRKRDLENELAQKRVDALNAVEELIQSEERKYEQLKKLRSAELARMIHDRLVPTLGAAATAGIQELIVSGVEDVVLRGGTSLQSRTGVKPVTPEQLARREFRAKLFRKFAGVSVAIALVAGIVFRAQILLFFESQQKDSYASRVLEERRIQSIYNPEQTTEFRETYTDNILYMKGYFETKTNPSYIEKWTLRLNDINFLKPLKLSEEDIVMFIAKETNLVQRLGVMRASIDAVYLNEGLGRMRSAEVEDIEEIKKILKNPDNYAKIRAVEKAFLAEYMARP